MNVSSKKIGLGVVALAVGLMGSVAVADIAQSKTRPSSNAVLQAARRTIVT